MPGTWGSQRICSGTVPIERDPGWASGLPALAGVDLAAWARGGGPAVWIGALALAFLLLIGFGRARARRRTRALADAASRLGLAFRAIDEAVVHEPFATLPLFHAGHRRRVRNVVRGDGLCIFDYRFATGGGRRRAVHRQTIAAVRVGSMPRLRAAPTGWTGEVGVPGLSSVGFPDDPAFARAYRVVGESALEVRRRLPAPLRRRLTADPGWVVEAGDDWVVCLRAGRLVEPSALPAWLEAAREIAAQMGDR